MTGDGDDPQDAIDPAIPVPIAATRPRRSDDEPRLRAFSFDALKWREVQVVANGFTYRGILVGADDVELYLRGELRWFVLPLDTVSEVKPAPGEGAPLASKIPGWDEEPA